MALLSSFEKTNSALTADTFLDLELVETINNHHNVWYYARSFPKPFRDREMLVSRVVFEDGKR